MAVINFVNVHPLDRDDDDAADERQDASATATDQGPHRQLLRWSISAIISVGVPLVVTSVIANNFPYGSSGYRIAYVASRILTFLLLLGFVGLLVAYQLTNLRKMLARMFEPVEPSSSSSTTSGGVSSFNRSTGRSLKRPLSWLVVVNLGLIVTLWGLAWLMNGYPLMGGISSMILASVASLVPALLITMIVFNRGFVRAYAIGALSTYVLNGLGFLGISMLMTTGTTRMASFRAGDYWYLAMQWTMVVLGGLQAAAYVWVLGIFRRSQRDSQTD